MAQLHQIAKTNDVPPGEGRAYDVAGRRIALFNVDGKFYAIDDTCTHQGGPLSEGFVDGTCVTCPWHGGEFDVCTGKVLAPPAAEDEASYKVVVSGEDVSVEVE